MRLSLLAAVGGAFLLACTAHAPPVRAQEEHSPWLAVTPPASPPPPAASALVMPESIRVRLLHSRRKIRIGATGPYEFTPLAGGKVISAKGSRTILGSNRRIVIGEKRIKGDVLVTPLQASDFISVNGRKYRGALLLEPLRDGAVDIVNQVNMDDYLYGVLPREVGVEWPLESLKAQAVVSRTYVLANKATDPAQRYDVSNNVMSQVYGGMDDEAPSTSQAVDATHGMVLVDRQGKPLEAFFHSSCGGRTETPQYVWKNHDAAEPFDSVTDSFCREDPYYHWRAEIPMTSVRARLRRAGIHMQTISKISIAERSPSGRAWVMMIYGSAGKRGISGNKFRMAMGTEVLRSTLITDIRKTKRGFVFEGRGWGHGVGLCQWGARGRALAGHSYQKILDAYYPQAQLVKVGS